MVTCNEKGDASCGEMNHITPKNQKDSHDDTILPVKHVNGVGPKHNGISEKSKACEKISSRITHIMINPRFDYIERDSSEFIIISLYVKKIEEDSIDVSFLENSLSVTFRTSDPVMMKKYPMLQEKNNYLSWSVELKGDIVPSKCTYRLKPINLELKVQKAKPGSWGALEANDSNGDNTSKDVRTDTWIPLAPLNAEAIQETPKVEYIKNEDSEIRNEPAPVVKIGYTGLVNLGNTCYMNSVIQCLANTTPLRNYFQESKFQPEINQTNPLGFHGDLALSFALLLRQMWSGKRDAIEPSRLKQLLANRAPQFSGYAQHDAQEFMAFLLDGLHEDLNRVKCKPATSAVESDGRPDAQVAEEAWNVYKKRNDSVIVDLFQGQYRSCLVCPTCRKVSVTFDPFLYLSLPLPPAKIRLTVGLFFLDTNIQPVKVTTWLEANATADVWKEEIKRVSAIDSSSNLQIVEVYEGLIRRFIDDELPVNSLHNSDVFLAFETLVPSPDVVTIAIVQRLMVPKNTQKRCAACKKENGDEGKSLKRCTKCLDVAYCDQTCQRNHWNVHKSTCRPKPVVVAQPFIISLRKTQLTYRNLYDTMLSYSRFSVDVTRVSTNQQMESDSNQLNPLFFIKPINHLGQGIAGRDRLEDQGETPLDLALTSHLALDWRNNEKSPVYCSVQIKPTQFQVVGDNVGHASAEKVTLQQCLQQFMQPEVLGQEEAWYCPRCKEHREATKQMSLWRLPDILIVQLKRFSFRNLLWRDKIDKKVHFPLRNLDVSPYLSSTAPSDRTTYDLFAVVNHYGGILAGHYTAFAQTLKLSDDPEPEIGWRCMDDRHVRDISTEDVVTSAAYCLLYRRRHEAPRIPHLPLNYSDPDEVD